MRDDAELTMLTVAGYIYILRSRVILAMQRGGVSCRKSVTRLNTHTRVIPSTDAFILVASSIAYDALDHGWAVLNRFASSDRDTPDSLPNARMCARSIRTPRRHFG